MSTKTWAVAMRNNGDAVFSIQEADDVLVDEHGSLCFCDLDSEDALKIVGIIAPDAWLGARLQQTLDTPATVE